MLIKGIKNPSADITALGFKHTATQFWNLGAGELTEHTLAIGDGVLADSGALTINTGEFTGRSPDDKFTVRDSITENAVNWTDKHNIAFTPEKFDALYNRVVAYLNDKNVYVKDAYACAADKYRLNLRLVAEKPWSAMFAGNMFLRPTAEELLAHDPEWTIICAPDFKADPAIDGTRQHNFAALSFTRKVILIGGTGYTGEIKKGIFTVLNFALPHFKGVFPMHCSANVGQDGDVAVFFGLSGTGKTTLSADPNRPLIGDDEHGWSDEGVFNFEGGCYAKTIDLSAEKEPQIYAAIRFGAILENIVFKKDTRIPDYEDATITQNTRVSYPIDYIDNALAKSEGTHPLNVFFLTCDAYGVLPPVSRLTPGQAMYNFISGYTARVAGTETGVTEPKPVFSACFGAPFLPLHPAQYAEMLGKKMQEHKVNVWLINTGWSGGAYGTGSRMKLSYTRAMITAALDGSLNKVEYQQMPIFGYQVPTSCPNVPAEILNPRNTWSDKAAYDAQAVKLANLFNNNFEKFKAQANDEILGGAPKV